MASFEETIRRIKKETLGSALRVLALVFILLILGISFIVWQQWNIKRGPLPEAAQEQELTDEQKKAILQSLSAPLDAPQYTNEEKKQILRNLSDLSDKPVLSDEEKKKILESLSAPR